MGSDESHFNVSVGSDGQSHRTVSTDHNLFFPVLSPFYYVGVLWPQLSKVLKPVRWAGKLWFVDTVL